MNSIKFLNAEYMYVYEREDEGEEFLIGLFGPESPHLFHKIY